MFGDYSIFRHGDRNGQRGDTAQNSTVFHSKGHSMSWLSVIFSLPLFHKQFHRQFQRQVHRQKTLVLVEDVVEVGNSQKSHAVGAITSAEQRAGRSTDTSCDTRSRDPFVHVNAKPANTLQSRSQMGRVCAPSRNTLAR